MLLAKSLKELRFDELMAVYAQSNAEKAEQDWPDLPRGFALELAERDFRQYLQEVFFPTPGAVYAIWEEKGRYVSALRLEPYGDGMLLEALETAPDCRNRGYARSLIRSVLMDSGVLGSGIVYSHVETKNTASLKTHEACGFRVISDCAVYIDGSVNRRAVTLCYDGRG